MDTSTTLSIIWSTIYTLVKSFLILYGIATIVCSAVAVNQERKIWAPANLPSLSMFAMTKVFVFNIIWVTSCTLGCLLIWIKHLLLLGQSDVVRESNEIVERYAAIGCSGLVGRVELRGAENLPPLVSEDGTKTTSIPAPVYIANHASQIDLGIVYFIKRRFKWIAKQSVLYIPGVGATMYTGDHVLINRTKGKNKSSVNNLFTKSNAAIQAGIPMFLFPQGTRVMSKRLPFKDGAFIMAQTNKSNIIPISLEIPLNAWETWYPLSSGAIPKIIVTVHKPIAVTGQEDRQELKTKCSDIIYSVLPKIYEETEPETTEHKGKTDKAPDKNKTDGPTEESKDEEPKKDK